jgi:hypothetical protein
VNTNLEEISDWLTKILVGVGLTQLTEMPEKFWGAAGRFVGALGGQAGSIAVQAVATALILHFLATGFFFGYLLTRLFLTGAFTRAERLPLEEMHEALREAGEQTRQAVSKVSERTDNVVKSVSELASLVDSRLAENQLISLLYVPPPGGFQEAIVRGEAYARRLADAASATLWVYLACAYGQQYRWQLEHSARQEELQATRTQALNAVKTALARDPSMQAWLSGLFRPPAGSGDDDLVPFQGDPEFESLVGRPMALAPEVRTA